MQWDKNNLLNFGVGCWKSEFWLYICIVERRVSNIRIDIGGISPDNYIEQAPLFFPQKVLGGFSFPQFSEILLQICNKKRKSNFITNL